MNELKYNMFKLNTHSLFSKVTAATEEEKSHMRLVIIVYGCNMDVFKELT